MIPIEQKQHIKIDLKYNKMDYVSERYYKQLCIDEINWCRKNIDIIINKASDVLKYKIGICHAKSNLLASLLRSQNIPTGVFLNI